jgi:DNA-binding MarR family transcriptional regulator
MTCDGTPSERDRFRAAYWQALHDLDALRLRQWERSQLTLPQLRVLFQLRRTPGVTTGQLARGLGITVSTTSGLVSKLADRGLVARGSNLTEIGQELAGELSRETRPFLDEVVGELGDGLEEVAGALERLVAATARVRER